MRFKKMSFMEWRSIFWIFAIFFSFQACGLSEEKKEEDSSVHILSSGEKQAFFTWLFKEMHQQIYAKPDGDSKDLAAWINVLNQGGSIEGVYHGLVLSTGYTDLEKGSAALPAVRLFGEEYAWLMHPGKTEKLEAERKKIAQKFLQDSVHSSLFTIKRELGELVLKEIEKRKNNRTGLSIWYGELATRWATRDVNFGMASRNKADFEFHRNWASTNSIGLIQWELLNRAHRMLNQYGGLALANKPAAASSTGLKK